MTVTCEHDAAEAYGVGSDAHRYARGRLNDRAAAEKAAAVADGERRRDASFETWGDSELLRSLRIMARYAAAATGLELTEAAKTTACHAILAEILRREP